MRTTSPERAVAEAQDLVAMYVRNSDLVAELIAERRTEAAREEDCARASLLRRNRR